MLYEKIQLESDEEILIEVRKHWFILVSELFGVVLMALMPFFLLAMFAILPSIPNLPIELHPEHHLDLITYAIAGWLLITFLAGFTIWTHYYLDLWIVTDRRIILIDQIHFFNRNVSIFRLERLQDIEYVIKGFIPTLFNFGTIKAQTASAFESNFKTVGLPNPRELQALIQKAMDDRLEDLHGHSSAVE